MWHVQMLVTGPSGGTFLTQVITVMTPLLRPIRKQMLLANELLYVVTTLTSHG